MGRGGQKADVGAGLKEALRVGTETVVGQLGKTGGFNLDPSIRIPLPRRLNTMRGWLEKFGMGNSFNDLETRLNRAAEAATPRAKSIFWQSIREMTLSDAMGIFNGPQDAATQYFRGKMSPRLQAEMSPVIATSLSRVGAIQKYDEIVSRYDGIPGAPKLALDLKNELAKHTLNGALDGIFLYLAKEEAAIRQNPAKRTTELLRAVFGNR
ncbi:MAG: hypothetical protein ACI8XO_002971 [Verrucomicrobiales bacterium]|jgi:hypothetical protein